MNKYLSEKYALLGKNPAKQDTLTKWVRGVAKSSLAQIVMFAVIIFIIGNLSLQKVLPYSWFSALASRTKSRIFSLSGANAHTLARSPAASIIG